MRTWMKAKYSSRKPRGRYGAVGDHNAKKEKKVGNRAGYVPDPTHERVLVIDGMTGARRWAWRPLA